jgi:hypothetical protein
LWPSRFGTAWAHAYGNGFNIQFETVPLDGTDAGKRFIEAWKRARIIVDTGGGHGSTPPTPPTPPTTPGK